MSKKGMMTPSASPTTEGMYGVYYVDAIENAGCADEYQMWDADNVAIGSVVYDSLQNVAVYDGEHWVMDDGTVIPNTIKQPLISSQTVVGDHDWIPEQTVDADFLALYSIPFLGPMDVPIDNLDVVIFDGVKYENIEWKEVEDGYSGYTVDGVFTIIDVAGEVSLATNGGEHTIRAYQNSTVLNGNMAMLDATLVSFTDNAYVMFDGKRYSCDKKETDFFTPFIGGELEYYGQTMVSPIFVPILDWSEYPFAVATIGDGYVLFTEDEAPHTVEVFIYEEETEETEY